MAKSQKVSSFRRSWLVCMESTSQEQSIPKEVTIEMVVDELPQLVDDVGVYGRHRSSKTSSEELESVRTDSGELMIW